MSSSDRFGGFPSIGAGTVVPNLFFSAVLPGMKSAEELLAFLWVSKLAQQQRGDARFATAGQIWAEPGAAASFERLAKGRAGLVRGLEACVSGGALLAVTIGGAEGEERCYFVNNPQSRRAVGRVRAGLLRLRPESVALPEPGSEEERPNIFRLYEEHIGTITPIMGDRLMAAEDRYPAAWIAEAFREAAELNKRNWRYVERILQNWSEEGRAHETIGRDSREEPGSWSGAGSLESIVRYR